MYVGQTCRTLKERAGKDGNNYKQCKLFGYAIKKYGWDNFEAHIICDHLSRQQANQLEKYYIQLLRTQDHHYGYNISAGGNDNTYQSIDITGKKFHKWTVIKLVDTPHGHTGRYWLCRCDCGTQKIIRQCNLTSGSTKSCGCYNVEQASHIIPNHYEINNGIVTVMLNDGYTITVDEETYNNKLASLHLSYDKSNKRFLASHDINLYRILFPDLNRKRFSQYIQHINNDNFDFRIENLKFKAPEGFKKEDFVSYLSENIQGIGMDKSTLKWIVKKNVIDNRQHSFSSYIDAKNFIIENKEELHYGN